MSKELKPVVYVAGVFSNGDTLPLEDQERNRAALRYYSAIFMKKGYAVLSPIENDQWAFESGIISYDEVIESDLAVIAKSDYIFFGPGWKRGKGTLIEYDFAKKNNIPILFDVDDVPHANDLFLLPRLNVTKQGK